MSFVVTRTVVAFVCAGAAAGALGQKPADYPVRPVRMLVGSSPGGGVDTMSRGVAARLSERWGQSFLVENRTGGGGTIAVTLLAQAAPDGYTLYGGGSQVVTATPLKKVPFDTRVVLAPVAQMTSSWYFLLAHPSLPVKSVQELVALTKRRPRTLAYGSAGVGSASHLGSELFKFRTGADMLHVPYKGNGQALIDLVSGQIQVMFTSTISGTPHVRSGRARALAVSSLKRLAPYPDVPTISESGVKGFELKNMYGIYAPAGVPAPILSALNREIGRIINSPEMAKHIAADGAEAAPPASQEEFKRRFAEEIDMWETFLKKTGIHVELR